MKYLYIALFTVIYLTVSTIDYNDQAAYYASNDTQGYEQAFWHEGQLVVPCHTDSECESLNPHIRGY